MTHYERLQVHESATQPVIKAAYIHLLRLYHPDRNPGNAVAEEMSKNITAAYQVLSDPAKKAQYDQELWLNRSKATQFPGADFKGFDFSQFMNAYPQNGYAGIHEAIQQTAMNAGQAAMNAAGTVFMSAMLAQLPPQLRELALKAMATAQAAKKAKAS